MAQTEQENINAAGAVGAAVIAAAAAAAAAAACDLDMLRPSYHVQLHTTKCMATSQTTLALRPPYRSNLSRPTYFPQHGPNSELMPLPRSLIPPMYLLLGECMSAMHGGGGGHSTQCHTLYSPQRALCSVSFVDMHKVLTPCSAVATVCMTIHWHPMPAPVEAMSLSMSTVLQCLSYPVPSSHFPPSHPIPSFPHTPPPPPPFNTPLPPPCDS